MKTFLWVLMTITAVSVFAMIYSCLTYIPPANMPRWQLPGIADKNFVASMATVLEALFVFILYIYKSLPKDK